MRRKPAVDTALFIPDSILDVYLEDAARQVAESWAQRPLRLPVSWLADQDVAAPDRAPTKGLTHMLTFAALLAFVGWTTATAWWVWLAVDTGESVWTMFAGVGTVSVIVATGIALRYLLTRPAQPAPLARPAQPAPLARPARKPSRRVEEA